MIIQRLYSNKKESKEERNKKDKSWDSVYGAGVGLASGVLGSGIVSKATKKIRNTTDEEFSVNYKKDEIDKLIKDKENILSDGDLGGRDAKIDNIHKKASLINEERLKELPKFQKRRLRLKRINKTSMVALPVIGSVVGGLYGRDNDLRKQRRKMEDAAGDKVAESIKNIGKKNK